MGTGRVAARWGIGVAALLACGAAGADGPASDPVEIRLLDVGDLTQGNADFLPDRGPFGAMAEQVNDEENPIFGRELEAARREVRGVADLIELMKSYAAPGAF